MGAPGTDRTTVSDIRHSGEEYSFTVAGPLGEHRIRFWGDLGRAPARPRSEPALAIALLPAMTVGGELSVPGPLSPQLQRTLPDIQAVVDRLAAESAFVPRPLRPIEIAAQDSDRAAEAPDAGEESVGSFFSGGVDSWQALLANPDASDAIYVHGFDIPIDRPDVSAVVESRLTEAVARQGRRLRVIRTNVRELTDLSVDWVIAHGTAMAAVALLVASERGRVLVPSTNTYAEPAARGSHPLHDHLWSTEWCRIEHYGAHLTRPQKLEQVAECQDALDVLRVCWREVGRYNCGACEKCLRTMTALEALGALGRCPAFPVPLDLELVADLRFRDPELPIFWGENLALARAHDAPAALTNAIEACLANSETQGEVVSPAESRLREVFDSRSWRFTAPLRRLGAAARRLRGGGT